MEMTYDGRLVMPTSFSKMDEKEMTYVEGGRRYSGSSGWACATALYALGGTIEGVGKFSTIASLVACASGGILGWIAGSVMAFTMFGVGKVGAKFRKAGQNALWKMSTKGYFNLNSSRNWSAFLKVS